MISKAHRLPSAFKEWTLLLDLCQLHVDLLADDGHGVPTQTGDHHGPQVSHVVVLTVGGHSTTDSISSFEEDDVDAEGLELPPSGQPSYTRSNDDDLE